MEPVLAPTFPEKTSIISTVGDHPSLPCPYLFGEEGISYEVGFFLSLLLFNYIYFEWGIYACSKRNQRLSSIHKRKSKPP